MQNSISSKYFIDDLPNSITSKIEFRKTISILEYHPNTKLDYRDSFAVALKNQGFIALSELLMQEIDYSEFAIRAKKEQELRPFDNNQFNSCKEDVGSTLNQKLKILKVKYNKIQSDNLSRIKTMERRHSQEIENLRDKHKLELRKLEQQSKNNLQSIQGQINELQHKIKLEADKEYAEKYYAEQKRIQEEKEKRELEQKFLNSFGISFVNTEHREILLSILKKFGKKERLSEEDIAWLTITGKQYFYKESEIYKNYHKIEAEYYTDLFNQDQDVWNAVNACSHFRKAKLAHQAEILFQKLLNKKILDKRLKSAFFTTFGGVMRDLSKFQEGIKLAEQAHRLLSRDYRPCTLLGALHFEINEYEKGQEWFYMAEKLGASEKNTDTEIKAIYNKANKADKDKLKTYLLEQNPKRYTWLKT